MSSLGDVADTADTATLIYERSKDGPARQGATSDSIDSKTYQSFAAASVVLGFGSFTTGDLGTATAILYSFATVAYIVAGWFTFKIVRARNFRVTDAADRWWPSHQNASADYVRRQMLDDLAESAAVNRAILKDKGEHIKGVLLATAAEVVLVAAAIIVGHVH